ncbi:MAG: 4-alpha-glucanotransferase [Thermoleophilia bacterium]
MLEPVSVVWDGRGGQATIRLPESEHDALLLCSLELDGGGGGGRTEWQARAGELPVLQRERLDRQATVVRQLGLPLALPAGYHRLTVSYRNREHSGLVIVAPTRGARSRPGGERPSYGVFLPLHAVRTQRGWGLGDLTDLESLASWAGTEGATVVSTLPLVAGFAGDPCEPSPYAPISRRFFHELWIDVERIPELAWSPAARRLVSDLASPPRGRRAGSRSSSTTRP